MPILAVTVFKDSKDRLSREVRGPGSGTILLHGNKVLCCEKNNINFIYI